MIETFGLTARLVNMLSFNPGKEGAFRHRASNGGDGLLGRLKESYEGNEGDEGIKMKGMVLL